MRPSLAHPCVTGTLPPPRVLARAPVGRTNEIVNHVLDVRASIDERVSIDSFERLHRKSQGIIVKQTDIYLNPIDRLPGRFIFIFFAVGVNVTR